ncbi:MAG: PolC-type DNA polymerase III [Novosphingobium sp.]
MRPRENDLSILPEQFIVFDLETTGLDSRKHEIIEIGAIRVNRDGQNHETFETLAKPTGKIPTKITSITGITNDMVHADGVTIAEALSDFKLFAGNLPMIAFNSSFDEAFLQASCRSVSMEQFSNPMYCALQLSRRAWPGRKSYRLSELASDGNLALDSEHRALGDCKRTMIVFAAAASTLGSYR